MSCSGQVLILQNMQTLAPKWSAVFERWDKLKRFQKEEIVEDLATGNKNPIAEARGFQTRYYDPENNQYCEECLWFSYSYSWVINHNTRDGEIYLDQDIVKIKGQQFSQHVFEHHNGHDNGSLQQQNPWKSTTSGSGYQQQQMRYHNGYGSTTQ
jgi:hypothetical protein